jgi:hypothetical protein
MAEGESRSSRDVGEVPLPGRAVVLWAALLSAAVALTLGAGAQSQDYATPFALPLAYRVLVGCEVFAMLVLVPAAAPGAPWITFALLWALAAPAAILTAWASDCTLSALLASQAYVALMAAVAVGWLRHDPDGRRAGLWWMLVGGLGAGCPFVAFAAGDALRMDLEWLSAFSPFWVVDRLSDSATLGWGTIAPAVAALALAALLLTWPEAESPE